MVPKTIGQRICDGFPTCQRRIRDSSPDPTVLHLELLSTCQSSLNAIDPAVSVVAFLESENSGTLPRGKRVRIPAFGLSQGFQGLIGRISLSIHEILAWLARF
jgi:hypothetical protein